jgi:hypothetical protein
VLDHPSRLLEVETFARTASDEDVRREWVERVLDAAIEDRETGAFDVRLLALSLAAVRDRLNNVRQRKIEERRARRWTGPVLPDREPYRQKVLDNFAQVAQRVDEAGGAAPLRRVCACAACERVRAAVERGMLPGLVIEIRTVPRGFTTAEQVWIVRKEA